MSLDCFSIYRCSTLLHCFDHSGMLFLVLALLFTVIVCFLIAYTMDKLNISRFFFGKGRIIQ